MSERDWSASAIDDPDAVTWEDSTAGAQDLPTYPGSEPETTMSAGTSDSTTHPDSGSDSGSTAQPAKDTVQTAKDQASQVGGQAVSSGKQVAGVAVDEVKSVASEAGQQARSLAGEARSQLSSQASTQQGNLAEWVKSLAEDLDSMLDGSRSDDQAGSGVASSFAKQASERAHSVASWLESHEPTDLVDEVSRFARQRPGTFIALAAVGGVLAGRLTRGLTAGSSGSSDSVTTGSSSSTFSPPDVTVTTPTTYGTSDPVVPEVSRAASLSEGAPLTSPSSVSSVSSDLSLSGDVDDEVGSFGSTGQDGR